MSKVRFQMFLERSEKEALRRLQKRNGASVAELIRRSVQKFLAEHDPGGNQCTNHGRAGELLSIAGICKGGPRDLADSHDKYLHGNRK